MRTQKGITLIALIITIVVLLILAAVAISSIQNNGILQYAQNAADSWNKAAQNEAGIISGYEGYLANIGKVEETGCTHNWSNGTCTKCNTTCSHTGEKTYTYVAIRVEGGWAGDGNGTHTKNTYCKTCNSFISSTVENCSFWNEDGMGYHPCPDCGEYDS